MGSCDTKSLLRFDLFKQQAKMADTATRFGLFLTVLFPLLLAAYVGVLIGLYATRPIVVTTRSESTFFTAPSVVLSCTCTNTTQSCFLGSTFLADNDLSAFCARTVPNSTTFTGRRRVQLCYAVRGSEKVYLEVPEGCSVVHSLESRSSAPFDFDNVSTALNSVQVTLPVDETVRSDWMFHKLREVHSEYVDTLPFYRPSVNLTVWWGVEERTVAIPPLTPCNGGAAKCSRFHLGTEAVFPVFIFERLGSVATLLAQIGGAFSLVMSTLYAIGMIYRVIEQNNKSFECVF